MAQKHQREARIAPNGHTPTHPDEFPIGPEPIWCKGKHGPHDLRLCGYKVKSDGRSRKCRACFNEARALKKAGGGSRGAGAPRTGSTPNLGPANQDLPARMEGYLL